MPGAAFIEVVALIAATTIAFWPKSMAAGILMLLYLGWDAFACVLNFTVWLLNG
jgi:tryptophan-rich sensory protein